jgi:acetoin utilization protein AcuC
MRAAFIYSPDIEEYPYPPECPFRSERAGMTLQTLRSMDLLGGQGRREVTPEPADRGALLGFHMAAYLDALEAAPKGHLDFDALSMGLGSADCPVFRGMYENSALACGASLTGADLILAGEVDVAFNPSGGMHHAHPGSCGGFCYMNDVVLACERLAAAGKRVLFLDIDVHHCDGVQDAFYGRRDVLTLSYHQDPATLFPGTGFVEQMGDGEGDGYTVNVPLPPGLYDEAFSRAFQAVAVPVIGAYKPDVIVLELGMDMLSGDPLANLQLTNNAHAEAIDYLMTLNLPILATGGGGYHVKNTVRGWALAWSIFCGEAASLDDMSLGLGGVLLETTDWQGGLRDRMLVSHAQQREAVEPVLDATLEKVRSLVFPKLGL